MKKINKIIYFSLFVLFTFTFKAESNILTIGDPDAKVTVKVFSSLTCPHCANFHNEIFENLKKDYIDKGLVKFEHHAFPLDLAALNAEIIVRCQSDNNKRFKLLNAIYDKQKFWAIGSDINKINDLIKKIAVDFDLTNKTMDKCLQDSIAQDKILEQRINAQKAYKIESTPTVFINEKKYKRDIDYKSFKKILDKNL